MISISIVDDEKGLRDSIATFVNGSPGFRCLSAYGTAEAALQGLPADSPDVVLMDINMAGMNGIECVERLKTLVPEMQIVMLTVYEDTDKIFAALAAGASGYLLKRTPQSEIIEAIRDVHRGNSPMTGHIARKVVQYFNQRGDANKEIEKLSKREREVLDHLAQGIAYKEIADVLSVSIDTVRMHIKGIYGKLHVHSRGEAVAKYLRK